MDVVLWIVAGLALLMAWAASRKASTLQDRVDTSRHETASARADLAELKERVDTLQKLLELMAGGREVDALMVREARLYRNAGVEEIQRQLESGGKPYVVDVRSPAEWGGGHIPGAVHIPVDSLEQRVGEVRRDGVPLYVICAGGGRSSAAAQFLSGRGFLNVFNVQSGMNAWRGEVVRD